MASPNMERICVSRVGRLYVLIPVFLIVGCMKEGVLQVFMFKPRFDLKRRMSQLSWDDFAARSCTTQDTDQVMWLGLR